MELSRRTLLGGAVATVAAMATGAAEAKTSGRILMPKRPKVILKDREHPSESLPVCALTAPSLIKWADAANRCYADTLTIIRWEGVFKIPLKSEDTMRLFAEACRDFGYHGAIREGGMAPGLLDALVVLQNAGILVKCISMYRHPAHQMYLVHTGQTSAKGEGQHPAGTAMDARPLKGGLAPMYDALAGHFSQFIQYAGRNSFAHVGVG